MINVKIKIPKKYLSKCSHCENGNLINPEWLRFVRRYKNITMKDMAKKIGLSQSYLSDIERGKRACPSIVLKEYKL